MGGGRWGGVTEFVDKKYTKTESSGGRRGISNLQTEKLDKTESLGGGGGGGGG